MARWRAEKRGRYWYDTETGKRISQDRAHELNSQQADAEKIAKARRERDRERKREARKDPATREAERERDRKRKRASRAKDRERHRETVRHTPEQLLFELWDELRQEPGAWKARLKDGQGKRVRFVFHVEDAGADEPRETRKRHVVTVEHLRGVEDFERALRSAKGSMMEADSEAAWLIDAVDVEIYD